MFPMGRGVWGVGNWHTLVRVTGERLEHIGVSVTVFGAHWCLWCHGVRWRLCDTQSGGLALPATSVSFIPLILIIIISISIAIIIIFIFIFIIIIAIVIIIKFRAG